jgi:amidophosphoribosyltransferase
LANQVIKSINHDWGNTVFSFIPNTAEVAYYGLMSELRTRRRDEVKAAILKASAAGQLNEALLDDLILRNWPRGEKVVSKDIKLRTFITQEKGRDLLVSHVYDITYGVVKPTDILVVIDDSIVRGTTLKKSILKILARTNPRKIVVCSTAPQIRYPDCYGIDMSELGKFIAFQAAVALHRRAGRQLLLDRICEDCRAEMEKPREEVTNRVKQVYAAFTDEEISNKIAEIVKPKNLQAELSIVYQTVPNLNLACPDHLGDWYFTGNFPTPGGNQVVNKSFVNFMKGIEVRAY